MSATPIPFLVGISGPSGAGKSYLSSLLANDLGSARVISLDWFFEIPEDGVYTNYLDIRCYNVEEFLANLGELLNGKAVRVPKIDFEDFRRVGFQTIEPCDIILAEGMALFRIPEIYAVLDISFFLSPPPEVVHGRKFARDTLERKRPREEIEAQLRWVMSEWQMDLEKLPSQVQVIDSPDPYPFIFASINAGAVLRKKQ